MTHNALTTSSIGPAAGGPNSLCESTILRILSVQNVSLLLQTAHFRDAFALKKRCLSFMLDRFGEVIATEVRRRSS